MDLTMRFVSTMEILGVLLKAWNLLMNTFYEHVIPQDCVSIAPDNDGVDHFRTHRHYGSSPNEDATDGHPTMMQCVHIKITVRKQST
jgi:hypothetical protein